MIFLFICGVMNIATIFIPKTTGRSRFYQLMMNGLSHQYHLVESTVIIRDIRSDIEFLFHFLIDFEFLFHFLMEFL